MNCQVCGTVTFCQPSLWDNSASGSCEPVGSSRKIQPARKGIDLVTLRVSRSTVSLDWDAEIAGKVAVSPVLEEWRETCAEKSWSSYLDTLLNVVTVRWPHSSRANRFTSKELSCRMNYRVAGVPPRRRMKAIYLIQLG